MQRNTFIRSVLLTLGIVVAVAMLPDIVRYEDSRDVTVPSSRAGTQSSISPHHVDTCYFAAGVMTMLRNSTCPFSLPCR
jgi:hypothetical protein